MSGWVEDFWSDGNWGVRQTIRDTEYEKRLAKKRKEECERKLNEFYRQKAKEEREAFFAKFGEDKYHGGPCCSSCMYDDPWLEMGCCCNTGDYALENKDYKPEHPPVNGLPPDVFYKFGRKTQERWLKRFEKELDVEIVFLDNHGTLALPKKWEPNNYTVKRC